jgi:hypothetical protein
MHPASLRARARRFVTRLRQLVAAACVAVSALGVSSVHAADSGTVTGSVSNSATGNMLSGARVTIPALNATGLTDDAVATFSATCRRANTRSP